jgi:hypothetical protein
MPTLKNGRSGKWRAPRGAAPGGVGDYAAVARCVYAALKRAAASTHSS